MADGLLEKNGLKVKVRFINQAQFVADMEAVLEKMKNVGVPDEVIEDSYAETYGGSCRICGKEYRAVQVRNDFADFVRYEPACQCISKEDEEREHRTQVWHAMRAGGVPSGYINVSFENWDSDIAPGIEKAFRAAYEYASERLYDKGKGLIMYGAVGSGKTRCGISVLRVIAENGGKAFYFLPMSNLIAKLIEEKGYLETLLQYDIVMFDDIDKINTQSDYVKTQVFSVFDSMMREERVIIGTTNMQDKDFDEKLGSAVTSRLMERNIFVKFDGGKELADYRLKRKSE